MKKVILVALVALGLGVGGCSSKVGSSNTTTSKQSGASQPGKEK